MGFDVARFETEVDQEFVCSICQDVFREPQMIASCEHIFCHECITDCWSRAKEPEKIQCPIDRKTVEKNSLKKPLRAFCNLLFNLSIRCEYDGCGKFFKLEQLDDHLRLCQFNPENLNKEIKCPKDCGAIIKIKDNSGHDCVQYLRKRDKERTLQCTADLRAKDVEIRNWQDKHKRLEETMRLMKEELVLSQRKLQAATENDNERLLNMRKEIETKDSMIAFKNKRIAELEARLETQANGGINRNSLTFTLTPHSAASARSFQFWRSASNNNSINESNNLIDIGPPEAGRSESSSRFYDQSNSNAEATETHSNGSGSSTEVGSVSTLSRVFGRLNNRSSSDQQINNTGVVVTGSGTIASNGTSSKKQESPPPVKKAPFIWNFLLPNANTNNGNGTDDANSQRKIEKREEDYEKAVATHCRISRLRLILSLFSRRLFYPANEYYRPVKLADKNAHAFTIFYEIKLLEILTRYLTRDSRVLDIGCGHGFLTCCITELAKHVIGLDHSRELVERAREIVATNFPGLNETKQIAFVHADGRAGHARHKPYDLILIEPITKRIPEELFDQLSSRGCIIAAWKAENTTRIVRVTRNENRQLSYDTLVTDSKFITKNNRDLLCDFGSGNANGGTSSASGERNNVTNLFNKIYNNVV